MRGSPLVLRYQLALSNKRGWPYAEWGLRPFSFPRSQDPGVLLKANLIGYPFLPGGVGGGIREDTGNRPRRFCLRGSWHGSKSARKAGPESLGWGVLVGLLAPTLLHLRKFRRPPKGDPNGGSEKGSKQQTHFKRCYGRIRLLGTVTIRSPQSRLPSTLRQPLRSKGRCFPQNDLHKRAGSVKQT